MHRRQPRRRRSGYGAGDLFKLTQVLDKTNMSEGWEKKAVFNYLEMCLMEECMTIKFYLECISRIGSMAVFILRQWISRSAHGSRFLPIGLDHPMAPVQQTRLSPWNLQSRLRICISGVTNTFMPVTITIACMTDIKKEVHRWSFKEREKSCPELWLRRPSM